MINFMVWIKEQYVRPGSKFARITGRVLAKEYTRSTLPRVGDSLLIGQNEVVVRSVKHDLDIETCSSFSIHVVGSLSPHGFDELAKDKTWTQLQNP
jgi:hypothetical protein